MTAEPLGCSTCEHAIRRFNGGNGATTCARLNHVMVAVGNTPPTTMPAECPKRAPPVVESKPLAVGDVKRNEAGEPLLCAYPNPCIGMQHHTVSRGSGIHQLDNRIVLSDPKWRPFHMGFALKPSPHPEVGKRGVLLNFCPWCGADLRAWLTAYQADIDAHKASLKAEHAAAGETGLATVDDAKPAKRSRKAVKA